VSKFAHIAAGGAIILAFLFWLTRGEGGFKKYTTLSGIYSVDMPDGVRCYVNRDGGAMSCIKNGGVK
jgi:hypothetical protein